MDQIIQIATATSGSEAEGWQRTRERVCEEKEQESLKEKEEWKRISNGSNPEKLEEVGMMVEGRS